MLTTFDAWIQLGLLLVGLASLLLPLHQRNVNRMNAIIARLDNQDRLAQALTDRIARHDRRTRKLGRRLIKMEEAYYASRLRRDRAGTTRARPGVSR